MKVELIVIDCGHSKRKGTDLATGSFYFEFLYLNPREVKNLKQIILYPISYSQFYKYCEQMNFLEGPEVEYHIG